MKKLKNIDELIDSFKNFGGKFENVELRYTDEAGYCCYAIDANQDTIISCPKNLLVDILDVGVSEDGLFLLNSEKYGSNVEFLNMYFSFHFNGEMLDQYIVQKRQIDSLSSKDLSIIRNVLPPSVYKLGEQEEHEFAKNRIFDCHKIKYFGKHVLMPFVTFLNHDTNGVPYDINQDAITVSTKCEGEVFAEYNRSDVFLFGGTYGFVTDSKFAYSLPVRFEMPSGISVTVSRQIEKSTYPAGGGRIRPVVQKDHLGNINISWFPLYFEGAPRYPAALAGMIAAETNIPAVMLLFEIIRLNIQYLIPAAFHLKDSENLFAKYVAIVAQRQLEIIAGSRG